MSTEAIISELQDTVEYFCGLYDDNGELKGRALESLKMHWKGLRYSTL